MLRYLDTFTITFIMKLFCMLSIWSTLLIMRCFAETSDSKLFASLSQVCTFFFPFNKDNSSIILPGDFCTAVSTCSEFGPHPPPTGLRVKDTFEELGLPYVYNYDEKKYSEMKESVLEDNMQTFVDHLNTLINYHKIDIMVFDFLFIEGDEEIDEEFQKNLKLLFDKMKTSHQKMLFGLRIHRDAEVNKKLFNLVVIDGCIDFYVVNSYGYHQCVYEQFQNDMAPPPSIDDLSKTLTDLKLSGYDEKKLFFTIEIVVKSWKNKDEDSAEDWPYSWMCHADPGDDRRYCKGCLDNFYEQGQFITSNNLPGVFIQAADFDDLKGNCKCGEFPAVQAIYDGLLGIPKDRTNVKCRSFGLLKTEHSSEESTEWYSIF